MMLNYLWAIGEDQPRYLGCVNRWARDIRTAGEKFAELHPWIAGVAISLALGIPVGLLLGWSVVVEMVEPV